MSTEELLLEIQMLREENEQLKKLENSRKNYYLYEIWIYDNKGNKVEHYN